MYFRAIFTASKFGVGTYIHLVEDVTIAGALPVQLAPGHQLKFETQNSFVGAGKVVKLVGVGAEIELDDGTAWLISPRDPTTDRITPSITSGAGVHWSDWVVRRQL